MKLIEKMAHESSKLWHASISKDAESFIGTDLLYQLAFKAGFRACRELILKNRKWARTNWVEAPKEDLAEFGENEVE